MTPDEILRKINNLKVNLKIYNKQQKEIKKEIKSLGFKSLSKKEIEKQLNKDKKEREELIKRAEKILNKI